ncbi:fasciclin-3-like isoform X2 [Toxorhynchites rutilus septentrionalis]|uniref:fasciclin-3-like isoform X2 n=1 Tax=Toxorhynchites rutilus septentrionalis TaxID=329112 RepID=UPI00247A4319|nr:fasciclin-3-like isoform X2 [Toxorhynchites rutilus septentrionalis]
MVDKQQFFLPCFMLCAIFSAVITAQQIQVDTDPRELVVTENQRNVSLLCRIGRPIDICIFLLPNSNQSLLLNPSNTEDRGIRYFGPGYQAGACGITIDRITSAHNGQIKCSLFVGGLSQEGFINLIVAVAPEPPIIQTEVETTSFQVDTELIAHCVTKGGKPGATLAWFLENEPIYEGITPQQEFIEEGREGITNVLSLRRFIHASDSGKRLICEAKHIAYADGVSRTSLPITVNFAPQALPETTIHGLMLGRTVDISLMIHSNPPPRTYWTVEGIEIEEGHESDRYAARIPEPLDNGAYNVTLTIAGLTLEDLSKTYHMRASNRFGAQDYSVVLSSLEADVDESSGVGIGGIIGIVLAALIVLTAVALIIVARATGRWCFRGKATSASASNAKIGETDTTDDRGAGQQLLPSPTTTTTTAASGLGGDTPRDNGSPKVYNETTIPLMRPRNLRNPDLLQSAIQREPQLSVTSNSSSIDCASINSCDSSITGNPNQVGLPVVKTNRWIPSQQRELLEKQANLLMSGANIKRKRETEIF